MKESSQYQPSFRIVNGIEQEIRETIHTQMRGAALHMVQSLFSEEVDRLCGPMMPSEQRAVTIRIFLLSI